MKVYVDDMVVKSVQNDEHCTNLQGTFQVLCQYDMKLRPKKICLWSSIGKIPGRVRLVARG